MEYEYALSKEKPTIAFLHANPGAILASKTETADAGKQKLEAFRRLAQTKVVKYWSSPADLGSKVSRSVVRLIKDHPAAGWVRANEAAEVAAPEILRLRERIDELQDQLDKAAQQPPEGSGQLAQGSDEHKLDFDVNFVDQNGDVVWESVYWVPASWDTIFRATAPYMIDRASEREMARTLEHSFRPELEEIAKDDNDLKAEKWDDVPELKGVSLKTEDLKTVIVQLRALGLITRDERKGNPRDSTTYWTLTPLGDQTMTRLMAIRKSEGNAPEEKPLTETKPEGTSGGKVKE